MITILSPAKNMKIEQNGTPPRSLPSCMEEAKSVWEVLKKYNPLDLQILMKINEKLSEDSFDRIQAIKWDGSGTAALETYDGIQYKYMDSMTFSEEAKEFAQEHVRILSGLYGIVRPYDSIYEYRLEMLTKMSVNGSKNLYDFWGRRLYDELIREMKGERMILNLASEEYGKIIRRYIEDDTEFVTCTFKTYSKGKHKVLATAAKMARGSMVRYLSMNQIDNLDGVKSFDWNGYRYEDSLSSQKELVFLQD